MKKSTLLLAFCMSALGSTAQISDPGFENWATDNFGYRYLAGWEHFAGSTDMVNQSYFGTYRDSLPHDGNYALTLSRWYHYTWDRVRQTKPINFRPEALTGFYRYTNNEVIGPYPLDSALVQVFLTLQGDTIGVGSLEMGASASFSNFTCPVTYSSSQTPDQVSIHIIPTKWITGGAQSMEPWSCFLTVDDLSLVPENVSSASEPVNQNHFSVYPNPAKNAVTVQLHKAAENTSTIQLLDLQGRLVVQKTMPAAGNNSIQLPLNDLPSGLYSVKVISDRNVWTQKLVVK